MGAAAPLMVLTAGSSIAGAIGQGKQAKREAQLGEFEAKIHGMNADLAEQQAEDAIAKGREIELRHRRGVRQLVGSNRASAAAQGVDLSSGSTAAIEAEIGEFGEMDAQMIRTNAAREAHGLRTEAWSHRNQATLARMGGRNRAAALKQGAVNTLLTGATQTYGIYREYK